MIGLRYSQPGFDNFIIANADTVMSRPSTELMAEFFPKTEIRGLLEGTESVCSIEKARRLLGWEPRHTPGGTMRPRDLDIMSDTLDRRVR